MMANHRPLPLTTFGPIHIAQCMYIHVVRVHVQYNVHREQLLGQPVTNFVFEFGISALMTFILNFGTYRRIKARRRMVIVQCITCVDIDQYIIMYTCQYIYESVHCVHVCGFRIAKRGKIMRPNLSDVP